MRPSLVIITGLSGSGKHSASKAFEDLGYFCVDNLPTPLVPRLIELAEASDGRIDKMAIVVDVRFRESIARFTDLFQHLKAGGKAFTVLFFEAGDRTLARRYSETRRVHPLAKESSLMEGLQAEREQMAPVRAVADWVIDTSQLTVHDLRKLVYENFRDERSPGEIQLTILSFGYKRGIPFQSDLVFDIRFLPNPHFEPHLRELTGNDAPVAEYMNQQPETAEILQKLEDLLEYLLPRYSREGKSYLTVAIGCTGGRHRSVAVANALRERLSAKGHRVSAVHRDVHRK